MNKETIEKAAIEKAAFKYGCEHQVAPATGGELEKGFINGAHWRIDSVWHDAKKEKPNGMSVILIDFANDAGEEYGLGVSSEDLVGAKRWAYISDLIPGRKEDGR